MEMYQVTLYKGTGPGWEASPPLIDPITVKAGDSYEAAKQAIAQYLGKPTKLEITHRPPETTGMAFKTTESPKIVMYVEDLNILRKPSKPLLW